MENGRLTVYTGPMLAGKTTALLEEMERYDTVLAVTPVTDDRYGTGRIATHDGWERDATPVAPGTPEQIYDAVKQEQPELVGIDEAQFFDTALVDVVETLRGGNEVVVAGLDRDFRGEPFQPVPAIARVADAVERIPAACARCGDAAYLTQRLIDGDPAPYDAPVVDVGGAEKYEPRCTHHHVVPGRD